MSYGAVHPMLNIHFIDPACLKKGEGYELYKQGFRKKRGWMIKKLDGFDAKEYIQKYIRFKYEMTENGVPIIYIHDDGIWIWRKGEILHELYNANFKFNKDKQRYEYQPTVTRFLEAEIVNGGLVLTTHKIKMDLNYNGFIELIRTD